MFSIFIFYLFFLFKYIYLIQIKGNYHHSKILNAFSSNEYLTIPISFENKKYKKQKFNFLLDINSNINIIFSNSIKSNGYKFINKNVNINNLKKYSLSWTQNRNMIGYVIQDNLILTEKIKINNFSIILITESNFDISYVKFEGVLSLNFYNNLGNENSLLNKLLIETIFINKNYINYSIKFYSKNNFYLNFENEINNLESYNFCESRNLNNNRIEKLMCKLDSISFKNNSIINKYNIIDVIFDTSKRFIQAPNPMGYDVFKIYLQESNNLCKVKIDLLLDGHYLDCNNFDIKKFPEIYLNLANSKIKIKLNPNEIFDENKKSKIFIINFSNVWIINLNLLKNYDILVNNKENLIGLKENKIFIRKYDLLFCRKFIISINNLFLIIGIVLNVIIYYKKVYYK